MARKVEGTGKCMLAFRGDMPLDLFLEKENLLDFLLWLRRLPKRHGKNHKRNKYSKIGIEPDKHVAIAEADEKDRKIIDEVRARTDLDLRGKRAELAKRIKPRVSDAAVEHHHARVSAIARSAKDGLRWTGPAFVSVLPEFRRRAAAADNRNPDPLVLRVTDEKKRCVWSLERISDLFTSSIYTGCFSEHRRWRPGIKIIRDGLYWLPLIQFTVGPRPEEAAALRKDSVRLRDGILCFAFEMRPDSRQKNKASERLVPIPQLLLRLGFAEWWRDQLTLPGDLLFPELPASAIDGTVSDLFGKSRGRIFEHLGIRDAKEDFYAGRMTTATELLALGAPDHVRQSILGHEHGSVINRHYTQANLELMKQYLDQIDLGLIVEHDRRYRFPVVRGCALLAEKALRVSLTLDEANQPTCIEVREPDNGVSHRLFAEGSVNPKDRASVADNLCRMGQRLATLLAGRRYRIEGVVDITVHRVLEVLLAVAFVDAPSAAAVPDPAMAGASSAGLTPKSRKVARPEPRSRLQAFRGAPAGNATVAAEPVQKMLAGGP
jgi:integrase